LASLRVGRLAVYAASANPTSDFTLRRLQGYVRNPISSVLRELPVISLFCFGPSISLRSARAGWVVPIRSLSEKPAGSGIANRGDFIAPQGDETGPPRASKQHRGSFAMNRRAKSAPPGRFAADAITALADRVIPNRDQGHGILAGTRPPATRLDRRLGSPPRLIFSCFLCTRPQ